MSTSTGRTKLDHISKFPDCVISHILSFLPTKDAVRTSVLSKFWENKWTLKYNIALVDDMPYGSNEGSEAHFANFVDRALLRSQCLQSFRLSCLKKYDLIRVGTWISTALSHNVHNLEIKYKCGGLVLPCNLLNCYSLRELYLDISPCTLKVPAMICFPHLTFLLLKGVEFVNEFCNSDVIKLNFPVLETLILMFCKWLNVKIVEIHAPKMTRFVTVRAHDAGVSDSAFKITGGSRFKFQTIGGIPESIMLSGGSEVVCLDLLGCCGDHLENGGLKIRELMNRFSSLQELNLVSRVAKALAVSKRGLALPKYYKLERLVMRCVNNTEVLLELLHATPFLKFIRFYQMSDLDYEYDAEKNVPSCIVSHLEEVVFDDSTCNMKLEKFILKNALQLKTMHVSGEKVVEELSTYPKASTCAIVRPQPSKPLTWELSLRNK